MNIHQKSCWIIYLNNSERFLTRFFDQKQIKLVKLKKITYNLILDLLLHKLNRNF